MAPTSLLDLPFEILIPIVSMVWEKGDGPSTYGKFNWGHWGPWTRSSLDLAAVAATCKTLHAIATPILYFSPSTSCQPYLLRTLINRPDLASLVHAVDLMDPTVQDEDGEYLDTVEYPENVFDQDDYAAIELAARRLNLDIRRGELEIQMNNSYLDVDATFMVADIILALVAENVEAIRYTAFCYMEVEPDDPPIATPSPLRGSGILFPRLQFFAMSVWDQLDDLTYGFDLAYRKEFLAMCPNLEVMWLNRCGAIPEDLNLHSLKSIRLSDSILAYKSVENLLSSCSVLEEFSYLAPWRNSSLGGWPPPHEHFLMRDLVKFLKPMARTLRCLVLEPVRAQELTLWEADTEPLGEFTRLETLLLHPTYFINASAKTLGQRPITQFWLDGQSIVDNLLKNIRCLAMSDTDGWDFAAAYKLKCAARDGLFPNLKKVVFAYRLDRSFEYHWSLKFHGKPPEYPTKWDMISGTFTEPEGPRCIDHDWSSRDDDGHPFLPVYDFNPGKDFLRPRPAPMC